VVESKHSTNTTPSPSMNQYIITSSKLVQICQIKQNLCWTKPSQYLA